MAYIKTSKEQNWLLPPSIRELIPKDHICFLVENYVDELDFSNFDLIYEGAGHPAYHPRIIMKILIYGMLCKTRSSRRLAKATRENFVFMYLAEKVNPDFRTINRFRMEHPEFVKDAFKKTVEIAAKHDLADLSFISIDGSMLKAYAGRKRYFDKNSLDKLDKAIEKMIEEDIALDELEDQLFDDREDGLTGVDRRDLKRIVREYREAEDKHKIKKDIKRAKNELEKYSLEKVSLSDPECRMMQSKKKFAELSYNVQLSTSKNQLLLANDVCQDKHDAHQFVPQIKNIKENIKLPKETKVGLDSGYSDGDNIKFAEDEKVDLYVPSRAQAQVLDDKERSLNHDNYEYDEEKDELIADGVRYKRRGMYTRKGGRKIHSFYNADIKKKKDVPYHFRERLRMKEKMKSDEGKKVYSLRKISVEPVYGNMKQNLGFREFLLRGKEKVKIEFNLACIAHNLQKIWKLKGATSC
ncbi:MAG: IS1182 family transposase [Candidatus Bathyarchaeota archaeon]